MLYFTILLSHTALAVAVVPLVTLTLIRAIRRQYAETRLDRATHFPNLALCRDHGRRDLPHALPSSDTAEPGPGII